MADGAAIAAAAMQQDLQRMNIISHNLANALTPAYKRAWPVSSSFAATMSANLPIDEDKGANVTPSTDFRSAPSRHTGNTLDVAIEGDGFFELQDSTGISYGRQGNFSLDATGRLVAADSAAVAGLSGDIHLESAAVRIDRTGRIFEKDNLAGQIKLVRFEDASKLVPVGQGRYKQGAAVPAPSLEAVSVRQGHVEASNVVAADEMVRLIETMRHFEGGQKVIQWYGDMMEQVITRLGQY